MKKTISIILTIFLMLSLSSQAFAVGIVYQNKPISMDVPAKIIDGRTLVPIRAINDALKGVTSWDKKTQRVTINKGNMNIILKIGDRTALVNKKEVKLDVPAQVLSNRTFVPLRFVSQYFGHKVEWDASSQTVLIDSDESYKQNSVIDGIDFTKIYEIEGTGEYKGYKRLKGYPDDDKYAIYYRGNFESFHVTYEDLYPKNLQEKITWKYNGKTYTHTRSQLYSFFSDIIKLESLLGQSKGIINQDWLSQTFGDTYLDWLLQMEYSQEAYSIVVKYLDYKENPNQNDRYSLIDFDMNLFKNNDDEIDLSIWISSKELSVNGDNIELTKRRIKVENKTEWKMAFIKSDSLAGMVTVIYEVPDMPLDYFDDENDSEDTFNGIRFKKVNNNVYINREDLKDKGVL